MEELTQSSDRSGSSLRFGVFLVQTYSWPALAASAQYIENLGFDSLWVADHFVNPYNPQVDWFEAWTTLAGLALVTGRIRLGPLVTHTYYRNPAILARQALTLDHLSGGRLNLGLGAGGTQVEEQQMNIPLGTPRERSGRFRESVVLLDGLLRGEPVDFSGEHFQIRGASLNPAPAQRPRPPMTIAAHGPMGLRLAAEFGQAWNTFYPGKDLSPSEAVEATRRRSDQLSEFAVAAGRDPEEIVRSLAVGYTVDQPFESLEAFQEFVGRYREAGIREFILGYMPGAEGMRVRFVTDPELLGRLAEEAIPALRAA